MAEVISQFALCSLADAKAYLRIPGSAEDDYLTILINTATERIEGFTDRKLKKRTGLTEFLDGTGTPDIILNELPIVTLTSVFVDLQRVFGADTALDLDDVIVSSEEGRISLEGDGLGTVLASVVFPRGTKIVKVVYDAGLETIPNDLRLACMKVVAMDYARSREGGDGVSAEAIGGRSVSWIDGMPQEIAQILRRYRRAA